MRVCWIIDSLGPGGAEALVPRFAAASAGSGLQMQVVVLRRTESRAHVASLRTAGISVSCLEARNLRDVGAFRRLLRRLRAEPPDVLHAHLTYATIWSALASYLTGIPLVATLHEMPHGPEAGLRERLLQSLMYRLLRWRASAVIAVSRAGARAAVATGLLRTDRIRVVPNGAPRPSAPPELATILRQRRELGLAETVPVAIAVAVLRPDKGLDVAIRAMAEVAEEVPDAVLLIVGSGPEEEALRRLAETGGVATRCVFAGRREDVQALYPVADVLVHPSRREVLPTVVLEAMAAGLPVVATDVGGTPEMLTSGVNGLLVPPDSPDALAHALLQLLRDPARARRMGIAGQRLASTALGAAGWVERLGSIYAAATRSRPTALRLQSTRDPS